MRKKNVRRASLRKRSFIDDLYGLYSDEIKEYVKDNFEDESELDAYIMNEDVRFDIANLLDYSDAQNLVCAEELSAKELFDYLMDNGVEESEILDVLADLLTEDMAKALAADAFSLADSSYKKWVKSESAGAFEKDARRMRLAKYRRMERW